MGKDVEGNGRGVKCYSGICVGELRKTVKTSVMVAGPGRDTNPGPPCTKHNVNQSITTFGATN
jgi:hypothetical protein